jgi:hypothetical protein
MPKEHESNLENEKIVGTPEEESDGGEHQVDLSPAEELAMSKGWVPKEEWEALGKDPKLWKSAELFNTHGELMERINTLGTAIDRYKETQKQMETATAKMAKHMAKQLKAEYERGKRELLAEKKRALRDEDHDAVIEIDEKLRENRELASKVEDEAQTSAEEAVQDQSPVDAALCNAWMQDAANAWYKTDEAAAALADKTFNQKIADGATTRQALQAASEKVKSRFPDLFETPKKRGKTTETDGDSRVEKRTAGTKGKYTMKSVDSATRAIVKEMVAAGATSKKGAAGEQEYLDTLADSGYFDE